MKTSSKVPDSLAHLSLDEVDARLREGRVSLADARAYVEAWNDGGAHFSKATVHGYVNSTAGRIVVECEDREGARSSLHRAEKAQRGLYDAQFSRFRQVRELAGNEKPQVDRILGQASYQYGRGCWEDCVRLSENARYLAEDILARIAKLA